MLQIVPKSHILGRLDHNVKGELATVDSERFSKIQNILGKFGSFVQGILLLPLDSA